MSKSLKDVAADMLSVAHNPGAMSRVVLAELEADGISLVTTNDPFVYAVQSTIMSAHAILQKVDNTLPKVFSSMSNTNEDIYRHLSDKDVLNVFAKPGVSSFIWIFDYDQLKANAKFMPNTKIGKITIPVDTKYTAKETTFAQPYPLDIKFLENDGLQIAWDTTYHNPITTLPPDVIDYNVNVSAYKGARRKLLVIHVPVEQMKVTKFTDNTIPGLVWANSYMVTDHFYTVRVTHYVNGVAKEMNKALSIDTIDPNTPTVVISLSGDIVRLTIPEVYTNNELVVGELMIEIVETLGDAIESYDNYTEQDFGFVFRDHRGHTNTMYTNILKLNTPTLISTSTLSGGREELSFDELKERSISNTLGSVKLPVTDDLLSDELKDKGYTVRKAIDSLTDRVYLATTKLPPITGSVSLTGPVGTVSSPVIFNKELLDDSPSIKRNGNRYTITKDTLFKVWANNITPYGDYTLSGLEMLNDLKKIELLENVKLLSLPYDVVIDLNNEFVDSRVYKLDEPKVLGRSLSSTNDAIEYIVNTVKQEILRTDTGYLVRVVSRFNESYGELLPERLACYLTHRDDSGTKFKEGVLIGSSGDDYVWEWELETNLDLDRANNLYLSNLENDTGDSYDHAIPLTTEFGIAYGVLGIVEDSQYTTIDGHFPTDFQGLGITLDTLRVKLGEHLPYLWCNARPLPGSFVYKKYAEDIPAIYPMDVFLADPKGGWQYDVVDGKAIPIVQHRKGDSIYESDGSVRVRHAKGTNVIVDGNNVIEDVSSIRIEIDLSLVDVRYLLAKTKEVMDYKTLWLGYLDDQLLNVIPSISTNTLARTEILLNCSNSIGRAKVMLDNELETFISAAQRFSVTYYIEESVRNDKDLMLVIKNTTNKVIYDYLNGAENVSIAAIGKVLGDALNYTVKGIVVEPMSLANNSKYFTVLDADATIGIAKRLAQSDDGTLTLEDDITTIFLNYKK